MPKRSSSFRSAFTLIEVMVAVMIVSVVIAALIQMRGNTNHKFMGIQKMMYTNQYNSLLLSQGDKYGFERSSLDMYRLVDNFDLESDLRRKLKSIKVSMEYEELTVIDTSEYEDSENEENTGASGIIFEIGRTEFKTPEFTGHLVRVRIQ